MGNTRTRMRDASSLRAPLTRTDVRERPGEEGARERRRDFPNEI